MTKFLMVHIKHCITFATTMVTVGIGGQLMFRDSPHNSTSLLSHLTILTCSVPDNPPVNIRWTVNGIVITSSDRLNISYNSVTGESQLAIDNLQYTDNGAYQCQALNSGGFVVLSSNIGYITAIGMYPHTRTLIYITYVQGILHGQIFMTTSPSKCFIIIIVIPYSGFFLRRKIFTNCPNPTFRGGNFHESRQEHTVPNAFSNYFEAKIFTNGYRFVKFVKIFPLEKTPLYGI